MCCIFTCCAWCVDLIQRCWTFTMSCCICMAVCCVLVVASIAGVALGYNYSLAEYIELKETNVSVYLKRGVFDDEFVNEVDWRRSGGGGPPAAAPEDGRRSDDGGVTGSQSEGVVSPRYKSTPMLMEEDMPVRSGPKLDDAILQSDDTQRYEGSLMKFKAKPDDLSIATKPPFQSPNKYETDLLNDPDQNNLKNRQSFINSRRKIYTGQPGGFTLNPYELGHPNLPPPMPEDSVRRMMSYQSETIPPNSMRHQIPDVMELMTQGPDDIDKIKKLVLSSPKTTTIITTTKKEKSDSPELKENIDPEVLKTLNEPEVKEYEEEDVKGLPIRRRRDTRQLVSETNTISDRNNLAYTTDDSTKTPAKKTDNRQKSKTFFEKLKEVFRFFTNAFNTRKKPKQSQVNFYTFSTSAIPLSKNSTQSTTVKTLLLKIYKSTVAP